MKKAGDSILVENKQTLSEMEKCVRFRDYFVLRHYKCFRDIKRVVFNMKTFRKHEGK